MPVPAAKLDQFWSYLGQFVDQARRENHAPVELEQIKAKIAARDMQLWGLRKGSRTVGAVVTEVYGETCAVPYVAGVGMADWLDLISVIEQWARENGCTRLEGNGRDGWARALKRHGWRVISTTVAKDL